MSDLWTKIARRDGARFRPQLGACDDLEKSRWLEIARDLRKAGLEAPGAPGLSKGARRRKNKAKRVRAKERKAQFRRELALEAPIVAAWIRGERKRKARAKAESYGLAMAPRTASIYALIDPRDHMIMYIGKSIRPDLRLASHVSNPFKTGNVRLGEWLTNLSNNGLTPTMRVLEVVPQAQWAKAERKWIAYHQATIYNVHPGGPISKRWRKAYKPAW